MDSHSLMSRSTNTKTQASFINPGTFRECIFGTVPYWLYIDVLRREVVLEFMQVYSYMDQVSSIRSNPVLCRNKGLGYVQGQQFSSQSISQLGLCFLNKLLCEESNLLSREAVLTLFSKNHVKHVSTTSALSSHVFYHWLKNWFNTL